MLAAGAASSGWDVPALREGLFLAAMVVAAADVVVDTGRQLIRGRLDVDLLMLLAALGAALLGGFGEAAVLRETSVVFAALIGWFILGEKVGPRRLALMTLIAIGAIIVEMGG